MNCCTFLLGIIGSSCSAVYCMSCDVSVSSFNQLKAKANIFGTAMYDAIIELYRHRLMSFAIVNNSSGCNLGSDFNLATLENMFRFSDNVWSKY